MSENQINYSDFEPDWWDAAGIAAEAVASEIDQLIDSTFGVGGLSAAEKAAVGAAAGRMYDSQQAMKAAAEAGVRALSYADQPDSPLFRDALASRLSYENIAKTAANDAGQILRNSGTDLALASKVAMVANILGPAINVAQLGAAASTGDAYVVAQKAVGVLAGMAFGALTVAAITAVTTVFALPAAPFWLLGGAAIVAGFAAGKAWEWMWSNGAAEFYGIQIGDEFSLQRTWSSVAELVNTSFNSARAFVQQRDPLILDLDGDGLELVAANGNILFDHNADGIKTGTGWAGADDGFLVRDLNGNGTIDSGRELFGVDTVKSNGQLATQGFDALADLDSNADGQITSADAAWSQLQVWRDANQDGISQAGEISTLGALNITRIGVNGSSSGPQAGQTINNNRVALSTTYTRAGVNRTVGAIDLEANGFFSEIPPEVVDEAGNPVTITETAAALPQMNGSGMVRSLRAAVSLSGTQADELEAALTAFAAATTRDAQKAQIDTVITEWAQTSSYWSSLEGYLGGTVTVNPPAGMTATEYRNMIAVLEAFNGSRFYGVSAANDVHHSQMANAH